MMSTNRPRGSSLVLRKGRAATMIAELARETQAGAVFWNEIAQARIKPSPIR
jgi:deoxyribodipyrimidine photo-lyase